MNRADRSAAIVRSAYRIVRSMAGSSANVNDFLLGRDNGEGQLTTTSATLFGLSHRRDSIVDVISALEATWHVFKPSGSRHAKCAGAAQIQRRAGLLSESSALEAVILPSCGWAWEAETTFRSTDFGSGTTRPQSWPSPQFNRAATRQTVAE